MFFVIYLTYQIFKSLPQVIYDVIIHTILSVFSDRGKKMVFSGSYKGTSDDSRIELRIDIDGKNPLNIISADVFRKEAAGESYLFSFICNEPQVQMKIPGPSISGSFVGEFQKKRYVGNYVVEIEGTFIIEYSTQKNAGITINTTVSGTPLNYNFAAKKYSNFFRTVSLEIDNVDGTELPPNKYDTLSVDIHPSDLEHRILNIKSCFSDAGVNMKSVRKHDVIPVGWGGPNAAFNDAELHHIMEQYMAGWKNIPQWKLYLLCTTIYEEIDGNPDPGTLGIMYDDQDFYPRQSSAVFYSALNSFFQGKELERNYLWTAVHELGHAFNLRHSFDKVNVFSEDASRPDSLSYMNYPQLYPYGVEPTPEQANENEMDYWSNFRFEFDREELEHIRHHYLREVIMGGDSFGLKGHYDVNPLEFSSISNDIPIGLNIRTSKEIFRFCEPVHVEIKLQNLNEKEMQLPGKLHPGAGLVKLFIKRPDGRIKGYEPLMKKCIRPEHTNLASKGDSKDSLYESSIIDYGGNGFNFRDPGEYEIWGVYDGIVISNIHKIRISYPGSSDDEEIAMLKHGREQGNLLYLSGSDSEYLENGHKKLLKVAEEYSDKALGAYVNMIEGMNLGWGFKDLIRSRVRKPDHKKALQHLEMADRPEFFDNITYHRMVDQIADSLSELGKNKDAATRLTELADHFAKQHVRDWVVYAIEDKARKIKRAR